MLIPYSYLFDYVVLQINQTAILKNMTHVHAKEAQ